MKIVFIDKNLCGQFIFGFSYSLNTFMVLQNRVKNLIVCRVIIPVNKNCASK